MEPKTSETEIFSRNNKYNEVETVDIYSVKEYNEQEMKLIDTCMRRPNYTFCKIIEIALIANLLDVTLEFLFQIDSKL